MRRRNKHHKERATDANITPLVDVVFLLIVFFILVTQFSAGTGRAPVRLPSVPGGGANIARTVAPITVSVAPVQNTQSAENGAVYELMDMAYQATPQGLRTLTLALTDLRLKQPRAAVAILADADAPATSVPPLLRACRDAGFETAELLATEPPNGAGPDLAR